MPGESWTVRVAPSSLAPGRDHRDPAAIPVALLADSDVDAWFVAPTELCARWSGGTAPPGYTERFGLSDGDEDPRLLIPEASSVPRIWADFATLLSKGRPPVNRNDFVVLVVNRLSTPLTFQLETGDFIYGAETGFPAERGWDGDKSEHRWRMPSGKYTVPAGNRAQGTCGVGVLAGGDPEDNYRGPGAVYRISPDASEQALTRTLWFGARSGYAWSQGRYLGVALTDDLEAYEGAEDFFEKELQAKRTNMAECVLPRGKDRLNPDAGYRARAFMAMLDPAPAGKDGDLEHGAYISRRKETSMGQAVLVIEPAGVDGKGAGA